MTAVTTAFISATIDANALGSAPNQATKGEIMITTIAIIATAAATIIYATLTFLLLLSMGKGRKGQIRPLIECREENGRIHTRNAGYGPALHVNYSYKKVDQERPVDVDDVTGDIRTEEEGPSIPLEGVQWVVLHLQGHGRPPLRATLGCGEGGGTSRRRLLPHRVPWQAEA